ncbi:myosin heavy chain 95F-like isoform X1 [Planococcus citri]|uniref:myosin heavy chain 95F-like isoform X1 n=2 Tax=Planococcus citri TaxID=170843 RepID=UPI0031F94ABF
MLMEKQKVWVSDPVEGFVMGRIVDIKMDEVVVQPLDSKKSPISCELDRAYPAEEYDSKDVDDNCALMHLNEATLLNNIRLRYQKDKIYTYVANILIAVNPYFEIKNLYAQSTMRSYQGKSLGVLSPHVFAIADKAFRDMKVLKQSQSIIVSGESGAGKTESTKYLLKYLCDLWGSAAGPIEQKILDANPVLEAFGNAKTTRNNNSSRFGKFMEIHFDSRYCVVGGYISHYLLEKSRICVQSSEERNYHFFYLLCAGAPEQLREKLKITNPDDFNYLRKGCTQYFTKNATEKTLKPNQISANHKKRGNLKDPLLDDVIDFQNVDRALSSIELSEAEKYNIYSVVAAVLHLGNIEFEENTDNNKGGSKVVDQSEKSLRIAAQLLSVDCDELRQALLTKVMMTNRGGIKGTVIMVPLKVYEANNARDALAKSIYSRLFDHIVKRINDSIPFKASSYYIGVLDIAGFEYFTTNSFEQFCINYCNEKLQQFFNERILKDEQELYEREGLQVRKIQFVDNQDCIDLIEAKSTGIFSLLDEESKLPKHSAEHFTNEVHRQWNGHFRLSVPRSSKLKVHRELRDDEGFLVRHFAGAVCYKTDQFIEKNNDALHANLEGLILESKNAFLQALFENSNDLSATLNKGKLTFISVGSKFRMQLSELMEKLKSTGTNFVRCIKPNHKMVDHCFEGGSILSQLQCSGMTSVLELMQQGYPSRCPFNELYKMYQKLMPPELARLDSRLFCKALFRAIGMSEKDYKFGVSKVFFRPGKFSEFDAIMRSDPENLATMISKVKKWLIASRWKKTQWCSLMVIKLKNKILYRRSCLITIQKNVRMHLAKKKHRHRYRGVIKMNSLKSILNKMEPLIGQLKEGKASFTENVNRLQSNFDASIKKIKNNEAISEDEIDKMYTNLMNEANKQLGELQQKVAKQKSSEEQSRIRKLQEDMEIERKRKVEEERKKKETQDLKKQKIEMEIRRKAEEHEQEKQMLEISKTTNFFEIEEEQKKIEKQLREKLEQERRDHELALRLARETNSVLDDAQPSNTSTKEPSLNQLLGEPNENGKYDLSKWKYSQLRDIINTSCDIKLLEACKAEFHRRLKVYHAWKAKNNRRSIMDENDRVPRSILEEANKPKTGIKKYEANTNSQRYFRIPFVRPAANSVNGTGDLGVKKGMWYAHFDGQYVARQMELHPEKPPILLIAGKDDMQMCELSLDETGLTRKRGAEIVESEFEKEWRRHHGPPYMRPGDPNRAGANGDAYRFGKTPINVS